MSNELPLPIAGRYVSLVGIARAVPLLHLHFWVQNVVEPDYVLYIDGPFEMTSDKEEAIVDPRAGPNPLYLRLVGKYVARAVATDDGRLAVEFRDGDRLTVGPRDYEPWQLEGDDGYRLVSVAGGGLDRWDEDLSS